MEPMSFTVEQELRHQGICDSSGAIALDRNHFVVANDEDNLLRVYAAHQSGHPIFTQDINAFFENNPDAKEVDLEAAAQLGDIIYWITSHGRNKKGKFKPERHQFFASRLSDRNTFEVEQVGRSYIQLVLEDMLNDPRLDRYAIREAEQLPPKEPGGLNIEGLSITPEGELLIGFRSPVVRGNALLVPLKNPDALVAGAKAILGDPIELDLDGLGIRSIEYWASQNCYLIVAGAGDGGDRFALYQWSGTSESPRLISGTGMPYDFHPEGVLFYGEEGDRFQLLSDDGSLVRVGDLPCKEVEDAQHPQKYFRSLWVKVHQG